ncbi:hypothetical protein AB0K18_09365 [Nonomuraea sp. NPDC049421]|uniref:Uncharacterized protein n=1 Tax=Nonomuraea salmonea TaxID=46181 RepID=A0ABV5NH36_9ACTN
MRFAIAYREREFRLWSYVPSHSRLLLRSGRETSGTTRIDIAFGDVSAVSLPVLMDGLTVEQPDAQATHDVAARLGPRAQLDDLLILRGHGYHGYVLASLVEVDESDRPLWEPDKWGICSPG